MARPRRVVRSTFVPPAPVGVASAPVPAEPGSQAFSAASVLRRQTASTLHRAHPTAPPLERPRVSVEVLRVEVRPPTASHLPPMCTGSGFELLTE